MAKSRNTEPKSGKQQTTKDKQYSDKGQLNENKQKPTPKPSGHKSVRPIISKDSN